MQNQQALSPVIFFHITGPTVTEVTFRNKFLRHFHITIHEL